MVLLITTHIVVITAIQVTEVITAIILVVGKIFMNQANYSIEEDVFGKYIIVKMDISLYSLAAIMKSTYWFTDRCFLYLNWADEDKKILSISFRGKESLNDKDLYVIAEEFMNSVLDQAIRIKVEEETRTVKSIIVKRAFSEALSKTEKEFLKHE